MRWRVAVTSCRSFKVLCSTFAASTSVVPQSEIMQLLICWVMFAGCARSRLIRNRALVLTARHPSATKYYLDFEREVRAWPV